MAKMKVNGQLIDTDEEKEKEIVVEKVPSSLRETISRPIVSDSLKQELIEKADNIANAWRKTSAEVPTVDSENKKEKKTMEEKQVEVVMNAQQETTPAQEVSVEKQEKMPAYTPTDPTEALSRAMLSCMEKKNSSWETMKEGFLMGTGTAAGAITVYGIVQLGIKVYKWVNGTPAN